MLGSATPVKPVPSDLNVRPFGRTPPASTEYVIGPVPVAATPSFTMREHAAPNDTELSVHEGGITIEYRMITTPFAPSEPDELVVPPPPDPGLNPSREVPPPAPVPPVPATQDEHSDDLAPPPPEPYTTVEPVINDEQPSPPTPPPEALASFPCAHAPEPPPAPRADIPAPPEYPLFAPPTLDELVVTAPPAPKL